MKQRILTLTSISHFINDGNSWFLPVTFTFLIEYLGISKFLIGILGGVFFGISALTSPLITRIADKTSSYSKIMGIGILLWGFSLILFGISIQINSLPFIILSVALAGFSSTFYHPLGAAMLSITYKGNAGIALGINGSMGSLGRAIYPTLTLALFAVLHRNMTLTAVILGVVSLIAAIPSLIINVNLASKDDPKNVIKGNMRSPIIVIILLTITALLRSVFTQGISQFLPTLLVENYGYSYNVNLGEAISIALAAAIVGQPILGLLSDRVGRRTIYGISTAGAVISFLTFLKIPSIILLSLFGFFTFSAFPLMLSIVGDFVPRNSASFANSLVWGLGVTGGGVIGPVIVGILAQMYNLILATELVSVVGLISALLIPFIPRPPKRSKVPLFG
ncbi:MFS transporter [Saccharolobus caldissimus]|uniref:MFS transporter n=1 Tax=Saccharolobus caldissimus TaxID=1702097 RepID=A0AAQ4CPY0_9CREN|nr:MFS transporter [Saccharolobus caldissimus]BDB97861.1 MFS transporter [Saccharolobus caldissimus]